LKIKSGKIERIPTRYSEELNRIINWMLSVDQERRPSVEDLLNLPQISLRLRERRLKDNMAKLKKYEESLKIKDEELEERIKIVEEREKDIENREEVLKALEKKLLEKDKNNFSSNFGYSTSGQTAGTSSGYHEPDKKNLDGSLNCNIKVKNTTTMSMSNSIYTLNTLNKMNSLNRSCYVCNMKDNNCSCELESEKDYKSIKRENSKESKQDQVKEDHENEYIKIKEYNHILNKEFHTDSAQNLQKIYIKKSLESPSQWIDMSLKTKQIPSESMENFARVSSFSNVNNVHNSVNMYEMFSERKGSSHERIGSDLEMINSQSSGKIFTGRVTSSVKTKDNFNTPNENSQISNQILFPRSPESSDNINNLKSTRKGLNNMRLSDQGYSHFNNDIYQNMKNVNNMQIPTENSKFAKITNSNMNPNGSHSFKFDPSLYTNKETANHKGEETQKPPITASSKSRQSSKNSNTRSIYSSHKNLLTTATPQSDTYATLTSTPQMSNRLINTPIKDNTKQSNSKYSSILTREPRSISPNIVANNYNTINSVRKSKIPYK
jgi:hypothetical protein